MASAPPPTDGCGRTILVVFHEEVHGGATRSVTRMIPILEGAGWRFALWASRPSRLFDDLSASGWEVHGAERTMGFSLASLRQPPGVTRRLAGAPGYFRSFRALLRERRPALVHANSLFSLNEALAASATRVPTILHVHEMLPAGWKGRAGRRIAHSALRDVVAVSRASAAEFALAGRTPDIVYEGAPLPAAAVAVRDRPAPFRVGTIGVISRRKGSDLFVDAAERLADRERFTFEMVGAPTDVLEREWAAEVLARAEASGVIHHESANVPEKLAEWDALVLPSRRDPFPIVVLEAMGAGLPIVGTRADGIAEQLSGGAGLLVEPGDAVSLAAGIERMAALPVAERREMGAAARERMGSHYTVEHQAAAMSRVYAAALGARAGAGEGEPANA